MIYVKFEDGINDITTQNLYQWDTYQSLKISGIDFTKNKPTIHFANKKSKEALVVSGVIDDTDNTFKVSIPNSLLAEKYDIVAYVYSNTAFTHQTIKTITIPITPRLKPTEYSQPSDEDIQEIEVIELEARAIIDNLTASEYSNTATYRRPNVVYYQGNTYMCNSGSDITGVLPTDTTKWTMTCKGTYLISMSKDDSGNLVFHYKDGTSYTVDIALTECNTVDDTNVPSLLLTSDDVNKIKNSKALDLSDNKVKLVKKLDFGDLYFVEGEGENACIPIGQKTGLFSLSVKSKKTSQHYTVMISVDTVGKEKYSTSVLENVNQYLYNWRVLYKYIKSEIGEHGEEINVYGFTIPSNWNDYGELIWARLIMGY